MKRIWQVRWSSQNNFLQTMTSVHQPYLFESGGQLVLLACQTNFSENAYIYAASNTTYNRLLRCALSFLRRFQ